MFNCPNLTFICRCWVGIHHIYFSNCFWWYSCFAASSILFVSVLTSKFCYSIKFLLKTSSLKRFNASFLILKNSSINESRYIRFFFLLVFFAALRPAGRVSPSEPSLHTPSLLSLLAKVGTVAAFNWSIDKVWNLINLQFHHHPNKFHFLFSVLVFFAFPSAHWYDYAILKCLLKWEKFEKPPKWRFSIGFSPVLVWIFEIGPYNGLSNKNHCTWI